MEFPSFGLQCHHEGCKQLDFLPLKCKCSKSFCSEHYNFHTIECSANQDVKNVQTNQSSDHIYICSHHGCRETSILPLICEKCKLHFCIAHRHINECGSPNLEEKAVAIKKLYEPVKKFNEAKAEVDKRIDANILNMRKKNKNTEMANKLQLMRIKNHAKGLKSIPTTDRVYFNVQQPNRTGQKTVPIFISKAWTIGRSIDAIADEMKLQNNNNKKEALKLRLFTNSGSIVSGSLSDKVQSLLVSKDIIDGDCLVLEYVAEDCLNIKI